VPTGRVPVGLWRSMVRSSRDDGRAWMVEHALATCRWRGLTVVGVACQVGDAVET
jgi:hypothetical protein